VDDERDAGSINAFDESRPAAFPVGAVLLVTEGGELERVGAGGTVAFEELLEKAGIGTGGGSLSVERDQRGGEGKEEEGTHRPQTTMRRIQAGDGGMKI
jgi:hypothetical protein